MDVNSLGSRVPARWLALAVVSLAQLMIVLDSTIVNIALPVAQQDLNMGDADRQWAITAYALVFGGLLLLGGRISGRIGHRRAAVIGLVGFALASGLGGLAPTAGVLYVARGVQGAFAALLAPAVLSLLTTTFRDARERGTAFGVFAGVSAAGSAVGLVAGGVLTEYLDWRWCLVINIPISAVALLGAPLLPAPAPSGSGERTDVLGVVLSAGGFAAIVGGFSRAESSGWADAGTWLLAVGGLLLLVAFFVVESRVSNPLLPIHLVRDRVRAAAFSTNLLIQVALFGFYLFMTFFTQGVLDYTPVQAGLTLVVTAAAAVVGSTVIAGRLLGRVGSSTLVVCGALAVAAGFVVLLLLPAGRTDVFLVYLVPAQLLIGLGMGTVMTPTSSLATAELEGSDAGVASATYNATQQLGAAVGTALTNTVATMATAAVASSAVLPPDVAAVSGYRVALGVGLALILAAALLGAVLLRTRTPTTPTAPTAPGARGPGGSDPGGSPLDPATAPGATVPGTLGKE